MGRNPPFGNEVKEGLLAIPRFDVTVSIVCQASVIFNRELILKNEGCRLRSCHSYQSRERNTSQIKTTAEFHRCCGRHWGRFDFLQENNVSLLSAIIKLSGKAKFSNFCSASLVRLPNITKFYD